jgi:TRAP-type mannitol/chloroaromatic compound transport system substrate-binding protein
MKRRKFLASTGAVAGVAVAFPKPAITQGVRELKLVTSWPKGLPGLGTGAERVARSITALSGGRLQVNVFAAGEFVGAFESFDAVAAGVADMYHSADYYWQSYSPAFSFFCAVPFGLTASEMNSWIYWGGGQELWDTLGAEFSLKPLLVGNTGVQMGGWFAKEVTGVESYKGLRYRMPGLGGEVLRRLGAIVVNLPGGEIVASLQSGAIDASEWIGPWNDMALGLHEAAKYYYYPGFHEPGTAFDLGVNKTLWDGLGPDDQNVIATAAAAENVRLLAEFNANNTAALDILVKEHGVQVRKLDDASLQALGKTSGEVLAETSQHDPLTRRVYESFLSFRKTAIRWGELSEQAYLNARSLQFPYGDLG